MKRLFDIWFSASVLCALALPLLVLCVLVRCKLGRPIFFRQERPGKDGKIFKMIKFRTMTDARDSAGNLLPDRDRLTSFGQFLRKTSLDEFPEFLNVLRGDMSVVGPQPLLIEYLPRYSPEQARRHEVKPALPVGRKSTGAMRFRGRKNFAAMFGMSIIAVFGWI